MGKIRSAVAISPTVFLHLWNKHTNLILKKCLLLSQLVLHKQPLSSLPHSHPRRRSWGDLVQVLKSEWRAEDVSVGLPVWNPIALDPKCGGNYTPTEDKQETTGTWQGLLVCHIHTFAASRHSITLRLKWEVAALFISTQLLAITKTAPLGSFTSVALRGLNSINLACGKKSDRGDNNYSGSGSGRAFKLVCIYFILRKSSTASFTDSQALR